MTTDQSRVEQLSRFVERVADKSDLEPAEAGSLVEEFLRVISEFVDPAAWSLMVEITGSNVEPAAIDQRPEDQRTIKEFLLEMSEEEDLADRRAATHARAVAETIRENATPEQLEELTGLIDDDFLALFETVERGELTDAELPDTWSD